MISPTVLGNYLFLLHDHLDSVRQYQLVQEASHQARLLVLPGKCFDDNRRQRLQDDLVRLLGDDITVMVEAVKEIPLEKSGKRPIIKLPGLQLRR